MNQCAQFILLQIYNMSKILSRKENPAFLILPFDVARHTIFILLPVASFVFSMVPFSLSALLTDAA